MRFNIEDYEPVDERIKRFYKDHPDGRIMADLLSDPNVIESCVVRASAYLGDLLVATGLAHERAGSGGANQTAHLENCETSAIGRALANYNYSGNKRASREEMAKVNREETDYTPMLKDIGQCADLEELRKVHSMYYKRLADDNAGRQVLTDAKDKRKTELTKPLNALAEKAFELKQEDIF